VPAVAAALMATPQVRFYHDHVLVKEGGEVLDEGTRVIGSAGHLGQRTRPGQDRVDGGGRGRYLAVVKYLADAGHAIPREGRRNR
jgi:hypothetical protein